MKKLLFASALFLFLIPGISRATHIVGGGFSYQPVGGGIYRFTLTLFFDFINGSPGAIDDFAKCFIFRKSDNRLLDSLVFQLVESDQFLPFTNPNCASRVNIRTNILVYNAQYNLSTARFSNPAGYYIIWERCCRNNIISNINMPEATGQTFYMEFPPVIQMGQPFSNHSPRFGVIRSDYPCINENFELSFAATDADGDELRYSLTDPLKGNSTPQLPAQTPAIPGPYDPVNWLPEFSGQNPLPGNPGLRVDSLTGLLTCRATSLGLFVFSVKCEEFRNNQKIGEVRLEIQITVVDCTPNQRPDIVVRSPETGVPLANEDTLRLFSSAVESCQDLTLIDQERNQPLSYRLVRLSPNSPSSLETLRQLFIGSGSDSVFTRFCVPACASAPKENPWKIMLIATDNGCSLPKSDTLILNLVVVPANREKPVLTLIPPQPDTLEIPQTGVAGFNVSAVQSQGGNLEMTSILLDRSGNEVTRGISTLPTGTGRGSVLLPFSWQEICTLADQSPFRLVTVVESVLCNDRLFDTLIQYIRIIPKVISIQLESSYSGSPDVSLKENSSVSFSLTGTVNESRPIRLEAISPLSGNPGFSFAGGSGTGQIQRNFSFDSRCEGESGIYPVTFIATSSYCDVEYKDTLAYTIQLQYFGDSTGSLPNLLTVNGDGKNEDFSLDSFLSSDNCFHQFEWIEIFNRWGKRIFFSRDRSFRWTPDKEIQDVFFYGLKFTRKHYSGWISVVH